MKAAHPHVSDMLTFLQDLRQVFERRYPKSTFVLEGDPTSSIDNTEWYLFAIKCTFAASLLYGMDLYRSRCLDR